MVDESLSMEYNKGMIKTIFSRPVIDYRTSGFRIWFFSRSRLAYGGFVGAVGMVLLAVIALGAITSGISVLLGSPEGFDLSVAWIPGAVFGGVAGLFVALVNFASLGIDEASYMLQNTLRFYVASLGSGQKDGDSLRLEMLSSIARWQGYSDGRPRGFARV